MTSSKPSAPAAVAKIKPPKSPTKAKTVGPANRAEKWRHDPAMIEDLFREGTYPYSNEARGL